MIAAISVVAVAAALGLAWCLLRWMGADPASVTASIAEPCNCRVIRSDSHGWTSGPAVGQASGNPEGYAPGNTGRAVPVENGRGLTTGEGVSPRLAGGAR